ncbi:MAG: N-acetylmuramoyl-L-alanine amidase [Ignavibacteriae bacterium]|nr:N-acetylmuramoyl-L-alanine amidase [Ignavibacteriota bacterium]
MRKTTAYIIAVFVLTCLILLPYPNPGKGNPYKQGKKLETIILDAGHGGKDPGTIGISGVYEKNIVLPITLKTRDFLLKDYNDMKVILTRDRDEFIELKNRGKIANNNNGDLFVSIHCNARKSEEVDKNGFEIYIMDLGRLNEAMNITYAENNFLNFEKKDSITFRQSVDYLVTSLAQNSFLKNSERMANILQQQMGLDTKLESRGIYQAGFYVLIGASMPTMLVETGYLSNKNDEEYLNSQKGQGDIAKAIYKAIRLYKFDYDYENLAK